MTKRGPTRGRSRWLLSVPAGAGLIALLAFAVVPVRADTGTVTVTATSVAKFTLSLSTSSVAFGTNLTPDAVASNGTDVAAYLDGSTGAYYVGAGSGASYAVVATVSSNQAWTGSVAASENTGSAGMTIGGGALHWNLGDMGSLAAAKAGSAFTVATDTSVWDTASSCASGAARSAGVCTYNFDYSLRIRWVDAPGTFNSVVTYAATQ